MRYSLAASTLLMAGLLSGCCWDCIGNDGNEYLSLAFSTDSLSGKGFRRAELRSVYVVRYSDQALANPLDTLRQPTTLSLYWPQGMLSLLPVSTTEAAASANWAFPQSYRVAVPAASKTYDINALEVDVSESECGCTQATLQRFELNGKPTEPGLSKVVILEK
ncbi:hypothetical protein HER32_14155 [Hymenobacter sp. BT18]|uniref:hypothetical protein n=1 Tax=Hymenobacter sp. BT18 TaxID=2835648 RepID=UPI00143EEBDF|nr:hypothetical protein [Hymenobacter sp. BT18]QIX62260.1 hypothetical protein HER32_14155 [Hymenobacter sp. BT18]